MGLPKKSLYPVPPATRSSVHARFEESVLCTVSRHRTDTKICVGTALYVPITVRAEALEMIKRSNSSMEANLSLYR